jgi:hypothetical protein
MRWNSGNLLPAPLNLASIASLIGVLHTAHVDAFEVRPNKDLTGGSVMTVKPDEACGHAKEHCAVKQKCMVLFLPFVVHQLRLSYPNDHRCRQKTVSSIKFYPLERTVSC